MNILPYAYVKAIAIKWVTGLCRYWCILCWLNFCLIFLFKYLCLCGQFSNAEWQEYNSHILHIFHGIELLYTRAWWARYITVMFRFTFSIGQRKFREVCQWTSSTWPTQKSLISLSYTRDLTLKQLLYWWNAGEVIIYRFPTV